MAAGKYNFTIEQGTTTKFEVQYNDDDGTPIDLTSYQCRMQIRSDYADFDSTLYATLSSSLAVDGTGLNLRGIDGSKQLTSGSIGVIISSAVTETFDFDEGVYDLELVTGSLPTKIFQFTPKLNSIFNLKFDNQSIDIILYNDDWKNNVYFIEQ
jgi:hypothetical protein